MSRAKARGFFIFDRVSEVTAMIDSAAFCSSSPGEGRGQQACNVRNGMV